MSNENQYKVGDTAVCRFCGKEIFFVGPHWLHPENATPDHKGLPVEDLKLYCIDDGERHWIAHVSENALKEYASEWYDIDLDYIEQIVEWPHDKEFTIYLSVFVCARIKVWVHYHPPQFYKLICFNGG